MFRVYALGRSSDGATGHRRIKHKLHLYIGRTNGHVSTRAYNSAIRSVGMLAIVTDRDCGSFIASLRSSVGRVLCSEPLTTADRCFGNGFIGISNIRARVSAGATGTVRCCLVTGTCISVSEGIASGCHGSLTTKALTTLPSSVTTVDRNIRGLIRTMFSRDVFGSVVSGTGRAGAPRGILGSGFCGGRFRAL